MAGYPKENNADISLKFEWDMTRILKVFASILCSFLIATGSAVAQQSLVDSVQEARKFYNTGLQFKNGSGVEIDYQQAYQHFQKAASYGDKQAEYALGYMLFKGMGCEQDYLKASWYFYRGAKLGRDNSMYFYALMLRNGYGVGKNLDSAQYWLERSASLGYRQAALELQNAFGENGDELPKELVKKIRSAAIPAKTTINRYQKITSHLAVDSILEGNYIGHLIQYDWSGEHVVSSNNLELILKKAGRNRLLAKWSEEGADQIEVGASIASDLITFDQLKYYRRDHYSTSKGTLHSLRSAKLNLIQQGDSVFIAGTVDMFSSERNEPAKPLFLVAARNTSSSRAAEHIEKVTLKAFPNPFDKVISVEFELLTKEKVEIQLLDLNGAVVFRNPAATLEAGKYAIPIKVDRLSQSIYLIRMKHGEKVEVLKVFRAN